MILVDTNLLLYAGTTCPEQEEARDWLDAKLSGSSKVGLPWESLLGYVRIASNPRVYDDPAPVDALWRQVRAWLSAVPAWTPTPVPTHADTLGELLGQVPHHRAVHDAHLAALAIGNGLTLCSSDTGFARFPGLRWENPLQS